MDLRYTGGSQVFAKTSQQPEISSPAHSSEQTQENTRQAAHNSLPDWVLILIACSLALLIGLPSLQGKFLADDFTWLNLLCTKPQEIFLSGLHSRYMYYPIFGEHYRPLLSIPFLFDAVLFGTNTVLLHLSNLLWHTACTALVFLTSKKILREFSAPSAVSTAFWAAAIFAVHPYHCENIGWWTAKNDIVYSFFYLLSLNFFLDKSGAKRKLSFATFLLALCCKESALTLPILLGALSFLHHLQRGERPGESGTDGTKNKRWYARLVEALKYSLRETKVFFLLLILFWAVRTACLGQIGGSYYGSLTNLWFENFSDRFGSLTKDSVLWYPVDFSDGVFSQVMLLLFAACYLVFGAGAIFSWLRRPKTASHGTDHEGEGFKFVLLYVAAFVALTLLPACLIWSPNNSLAGTRLLYLYSVPLSLFCATLLNGPLLQNVSSVFRNAMLASFTVLLALSCVQTHQRWCFASNYCTNLTHHIQKICSSLPINEKAYFVDIPRNVRGVSIIHHFSILQDSLRQPFFDGRDAEIVAGFEPHFFTEHDRVNMNRLRSMSSKSKEPYLFYVSPSNKLTNGNLFDLSNSNDIKLERLDLPAMSGHRNVFATRNFKVGVGTRSLNKGVPLRNFPVVLDGPVDGADFGIVRLLVKDAKETKRLKFTIYWKSAKEKTFDKKHSKFFHEPLEDFDASQRIPYPDGHRTLTVNMGTTITWLKEHDIDSILIMLMTDGPTIESIDLIPTNILLPTLNAVESSNAQTNRIPEQPSSGGETSVLAGSVLGNDGVLRSVAGNLAFRYDASSVPGCTAVQVEIAPALFDFMDMSRKQMEFEACSRPVRKFIVEGARSSFCTNDRLGSPVWHQIRVIPLDKNHAPIGYAAEPLYVQSVSSRSLASGGGQQ